MKIKVYSMLSGDVSGIYVVDFAGDEINIDNVGGIVIQSKKEFKLRGKVFTVLAQGKVFHVAEIQDGNKKKWKAYELIEKEEIKDEQD